MSKKDRLSEEQQLRARYKPAAEVIGNSADDEIRAYYRDKLEKMKAATGQVDGAAPAAAK